MNDEGAKPGGSPSDAPAEPKGGAGSTPPALSEDELAAILSAHARWVETGGGEGARADLSMANLSGAKLARARLQGARLSNAILVAANLSEANLSGADLGGAQLHHADLGEATLLDANLKEAGLQGARMQGAVLRDANLRSASAKEANLKGAHLTGADLSGADLRYVNLEAIVLIRGDGLDNIVEPAELSRTNLRNADLSDAKLSTVGGLLPDMLAGANLSNAKLPQKISTFEGLKHVEELSRNARTTFLAMLVGCVYCWLTIATTTDVRLLTNSASSPLPIIQTEIPIAWFYWAAPLLILSVYFYLHLYLHRLWHGLATLPAVFQDGKQLHDKAYPWLLNGLVRAHFPILRRRRDQFSYIQNAVSVLLAWWVVPVTLLLFWIRHLPRQDWVGTSVQIGCIFVATGFGALSYALARRTLRFRPTAFRKTTAWRDGRTFAASGHFAVAVILAAISWGAINGTRELGAAGLSVRWDWAEPRSWVPYGFDKFGYDVFANLRDATLSSKPANSWQLDDDDLLASVTGAKLQGASLRYADLTDAFLARADLRGARLDGAYLRGANLEDADLNGADLRGAVNLNCGRLQSAINWEHAYRDEECGAPIPEQSSTGEPQMRLP